MTARSKPRDTPFAIVRSHPPGRTIPSHVAGAPVRAKYTPLRAPIDQRNFHPGLPRLASPAGPTTLRLAVRGAAYTLLSGAAVGPVPARTPSSGRLEAHGPAPARRSSSPTDAVQVPPSRLVIHVAQRRPVLTPGGVDHGHFPLGTLVVSLANADMDDSGSWEESSNVLDCQGSVRARRTPKQ